MDKIVVLKYGGNAMTDEKIKDQLINNICLLKERGFKMVIIHGGGPFIEQTLKQVGIHSEFIDGQRKTSEHALGYIEMVLKGKINGSLVAMLNAKGQKAVGLSGKDGKLIIAKKRYHLNKKNNEIQPIDLGQVGEVDYIHTEILDILLNNNFLPVITCIAADENGNGFNINADNFAGHIAGALHAHEFILMTDVDGLMRNLEDPNSLITKINLNEVSQLIEKEIIQGGMIPKLEACKTALKGGATSARIINGTKPSKLLNIFQGQSEGTEIFK